MEKRIAMALTRKIANAIMRAMDWKQLVAEIRGAGLSQAEIGSRLGKSQVWVSELASGRYANPKWDDGQALIALHREVTRVQPELDAPPAAAV